MSFPNIVYLDYGQEKTTAASAIGNLPLGVLGVLPDGRKFRHARSSATAMVAGSLYQGNASAFAGDAAYINDLAVVSGGSVGSTQVVITAGATTGVSKDQLKDGMMYSTGGVGYKIKSNTVAAAGSSITIDLYEPIKVALAAGTTLVGLRENPFYSLTVTTADTVGGGQVAGVAPVAVTASYYCWIQRGGECNALTDGTLVKGVGIVPAATAAGAVHVFASATVSVKSNEIIGKCLDVAASTEFSRVWLSLE